MSFKGTQLYANRIDDEFLAIFNHKLRGILESFIPGLANDVKPEIQVFMEAVYYGVSLGFNIPTPGMRSFGLVPTIADESKLVKSAKARLVGFFVLTWILSRLEHTAILNGWRLEPPGSMRHRLSKLLVIVKVVSNVAKVSNIVSFLMHGKFPSLLYRCTAIDMAKSDGTAANPNSYLLYSRYRQLAWKTLTGFLAALTIIRHWQEVDFCLDSAARLYSRFVYFTNRLIWQSQVRATIAGRRIARFLSKQLGLAPQDMVPSDQVDDAQGGRGRSRPIESQGHLINDSNYDNILQHIPNRSSASDLHDPVAAPNPSTQRSMCVKCRCSPAESPHYLECGHVYCYLCVDVFQDKTIKESQTSQSRSTATILSYHCLICNRFNNTFKRVVVA